MLSLRHSIGNASPLESLARNSKSVPHFRCYASPPRTETYAQMHDLFHGLWVLCKILLCLLLFFSRKLWRTPTPFFVIQAGKMMCFPGIKPIVDRNTVNSEDSHKRSGIDALATQ